MYRCSDASVGGKDCPSASAAKKILASSMCMVKNTTDLGAQWLERTHHVYTMFVIQETCSRTIE